jgi:hypothetical protein
MMVLKSRVSSLTPTQKRLVFNNITLAEWKHPTAQLTHGEHFFRITTNLHQLA